MSIKQTGHARDVALVFCILSMSACSKSGPAPTSEKVSGTGGSEVRQVEGNQDQEQYTRSTKTSSLGQVELFSIKPDYFERRKKELAARTLAPLSLSADYNTEAYLLDGNEIAGLVISRPKVLLRSSVTGQRARLRDDRNGKIAVEVSVALVDGLIPELFTGKGTRAVPEELLVKNKAAFLVELEQILHRKPAFVASVRCPTDIKLRVEAVGEFDVSFKAKLKGCPINTFFPAEITLKTDEWQAVLIAFAEGRHVEIETTTNLSLPIASNYGKFALKRPAIRAALKESLKDVKEPYSIEQISAAQKELTGRLEDALEISFPQELYAPVQDAIVRDNLTLRFGNDCPPEHSACFSWKSDPGELSRGDYVAELRKEEYVGRPLLLTSRTQVSDYLSDHQEFMLRAAPDSPIEPPKMTEVSQLFRTVQDGEAAEFQITHLELGELSFEDAKTDRISNRVCIEPFSLCAQGRWRCTNSSSEDYNCRQECTGGNRRECVKQSCQCAEPESGPCSWCPGSAHELKCWEWQNICHGPTQVCDRRRVCDRLTQPVAPALPYRTDKINPSAPDFTWECTKLAQNQCDPDKWADHWQRVVSWAYPTLTPRAREEIWKKEYWEQTLNGLGMKFSWATDSGTQTLTCPISALEHRVVGRNRLLIVMHNTPQCQPFNNQNRISGYGPSISLTNQIVFPSEFQCGSLTESWDGKRRYVCRMGDKPEISLETTVLEDERRIGRGERVGIYQPYFPRVEIQGRLRMVGSYFESRGERL